MTPDNKAREGKNKEKGKQKVSGETAEGGNAKPEAPTRHAKHDEKGNKEAQNGGKKKDKDGVETKPEKKTSDKSRSPKAGARAEHSRWSVQSSVRNERHRDREAVSEEGTGKYKEAHVLLLTFTYHDLGDELDDETRDVSDTFRNWGYNVRSYTIPMRRSSFAVQRALNDFLKLAADDRLLIVYYHGLGSIHDEQFVLLG